jgi:hypothetical protein
MKNPRAFFTALFQGGLLGCLLFESAFAQTDWPNVGNDKGATKRGIPPTGTEIWAGRM